MTARSGFHIRAKSFPKVRRKYSAVYSFMKDHNLSGIPRAIEVQHGKMSGVSVASAFPAPAFGLFQH